MQGDTAHVVSSLLSGGEMKNSIDMLYIWVLVEN